MASLVIAVPPLSAQATDEPSVAAVTAYLHAATAAYQRNDLVAIDSLIPDDFTLTDSEGVITTKVDEIAAIRNGDISYQVFRNEGMAVRVYGDAAVITGQTIVTAKTRAGAVVNIKVQFTDMLVLREGRWRIVASHVSRLAVEE
jgi:ketosteroid isomerase-like protein